ncbi:MAG TPA: PaaI family thioesterase [Thermoanaerobaculia bacterium]|nr:PaaI family thioesterase [Thermoanaerobaculia bacterium]
MTLTPPNAEPAALDTDTADTDTADGDVVDVDVDLDWVEAQLGPDPGWQEMHHPPARRDLEPRRRRHGTGRFVPTEPNRSLALRCYRRVSDGAIVGKAWFGPEAGGPPGFAHGGAQMAVLDHAFGAAAWSCGLPVVTASMTYDFLRGLPIGTVARVEAVVESVEGRKVRTRGRLLDADGHVFGEGHALFVTMSDEARRKLGAARPDGDVPARADAEETAG